MVDDFDKDSLYFVFSGTLDDPWVTDLLKEQGRYGLMSWRVPGQRRTCLTVFTTAGEYTTAIIVKMLDSVAAAMPAVYFRQH